MLGYTHQIWKRYWSAGTARAKVLQNLEVRQGEQCQVLHNIQVMGRPAARMADQERVPKHLSKHNKDRRFLVTHQTKTPTS